ncbi:MAG: aquaporin [Dehalococcoidia bacterium]|nr:aquaporin [Dehalococcoidia bacterium]
MTSTTASSPRATSPRSTTSPSAERSRPTTSRPYTPSPHRRCATVTERSLAQAVTGATIDREWLGDRRGAVATLVSEVLGTFALVFFSAGAVAVDAASGGGVTPVGMGLAAGLVVVAAIFALGHVSGAHINPVVTLAFRLAGRIGSLRALAYVVAQLIGSVLAGLAIVAIVGDAGDAGATAPRIGGVDAALLAEVILTFFLALVIMGVATDERAQGSFAAIAVGSYVGLAILAWGPVGNASMNPARSLGPAIAGGEWSAHWIYWVGPVVGATLAVLVYSLLRARRSSAKDSS